MAFNLPNVLRARRKAQFKPVVFVPVESVFSPQQRIKMLKDVSGWVNGDKRTNTKYQFSAGKEYFVDQELADSYIIKGYAEGELSRHYSADEVESIKAAVVTIGVGGN